MMHQFCFARACTLAFVALAALPGTAVAADADAAPPSRHTITVRVRGPLAHVEVVRVLTPTPGGRRDAAEAVLDLALPPRAALLSVEVKGPAPEARWQPASPGDATRARRAYGDALLGRGLSAAREPADEGTTHRVRVVWSTDERSTADDPRPPLLRYRFVALLEPAAGRLHLRFPPSPDLEPVAAAVSVDASGAAELELPGQHLTVSAPGRRAHLRGTAPARTAWQIWVRPTLPLPAGTGAGPGLDAIAAAATLPGGDRALATASLARTPEKSEPPAGVLFLVDRSRSVGLPGLAAERDVARQLLERLPPATRFDVLFFDRRCKRLFGASRPATREAMDALDAEMVPDRMANGTDLGDALRTAGDLLRGEGAAFGPRVLLALITDGALPDDETAAALDQALGPTPGLDLQVAALLVRDPDEEPPPPVARAALRHLAAARGGVVRDVASNQILETTAAVLQALARGGDLFNVHVTAGDARRTLAAALAAGDGAAALARWPAAVAAKPASLHGTVRGRALVTPLRPLAADASWLRALLDPVPPASAGLLATAKLTALVEAVTPAPAHDPADEGRGSVDRTVVQNTLALAFMPRARACYQNRSGATPALRDLSGRVRLAIDLVRGEVAAARLESSTLGAPAIESCLRESAFALEVPRATRSDAPVTAIVNLVFRPRPPEKVRTAEDSFPVGGEIDLALEELRRFERSRSPAAPDSR